MDLYEGDRFTDEHLRLSVPGRYVDLKRLPGSDNKDWTDEADSIRVGPSAAVTIWRETQFRGASQALAPGSEHPDLVLEPSSLALDCS